MRYLTFLLLCFVFLMGCSTKEQLVKMSRYECTGYSKVHHIERYAIDERYIRNYYRDNRDKQAALNKLLVIEQQSLIDTTVVLSSRIEEMSIMNAIAFNFAGQLNKEYSDKVTTVFLSNHKSVKGRIIYVTSDSLFLGSEEKRKAIAWHTVERMVLAKKGVDKLSRAFLKGLLPYAAIYGITVIFKMPRKTLYNPKAISAGIGVALANMTRTLKAQKTVYVFTLYDDLSPQCQLFQRTGQEQSQENDY